jgi:hypothetical protein
MLKPAVKTCVLIELPKKPLYWLIYLACRPVAVLAGGHRRRPTDTPASYLKVHMHEILWFVFHNFLASFNNRQGRGPEFKKFC